MRLFSKRRLSLALLAMLAAIPAFVFAGHHDVFADTCYQAEYSGQQFNYDGVTAVATLTGSYCYNSSGGEYYEYELSVGTGPYQFEDSALSIDGFVCGNWDAPSVSHNWYAVASQDVIYGIFPTGGCWPPQADDDYREGGYLSYIVDLSGNVHYLPYLFVD